MKLLILTCIFAVYSYGFSTQGITRRVIRTIGYSGKTTGKWSEFSDNETVNVKNLLQHLQRSEEGKRLVHATAVKAGEQGKTIYDVIKQGGGSLTDTTLIRRFSVDNPDDISYETRSVVYINKDLGFFDAVLDLAHELTHFIYRRSFNPYSLNFSLEDFIKNTIEGTGGEAHAFVSECKVLQELFPSQLKKRKNCVTIYNENEGSFSVDSASREFYRLGSHYPNFIEKIESHDLSGKFPHASTEQVAFISSAYGLPYPIAAYEEYITVLKRVCQNDKKRLIYLMKGKSGRAPASEVSQAEQKYLKMCSRVST